MLELLEPTTVKLSNVQTRVEKHGDEEVMAIDLAVAWNTNNRSLTAIQKQLRNALFCNLAQEIDSPQAEMDLPVDEMPNVRVPGMDYPVKLDFQQIGARVEVAYGIDETTAIVLQLCKVHKFRITPIEGGSAEVKFAISSASEIDDHIIGTLSVLQQRDISIQLTMPEVEQPEKPLTEGDVFPGAPASEPKKKLTPEDVFLGTHAPRDTDGEGEEA
ncbi:hypothetical protein SAMN05518669_103409 [Variovorax sp. YR634]|uniref:hypothetical protein n=1 Tax=Variovorax sp. YR634 TaxID=1884385 RepID=UPI00089505C1|nr:hypothetical protein [Variovorax sp. YR634]SDX15071.1 hypothetical protein SAMN05518669_103409 [Variovorax sp. YR634]